MNCLLSDAPCDLGYPCTVSDGSNNPANLSMCLPPSMTCDGKPDCPIGDDEFYCAGMVYTIQGVSKMMHP